MKRNNVIEFPKGKISEDSPYNRFGFWIVLGLVMLFAMIGAIY
jgi:hypothetical protein